MAQMIVFEGISGSGKSTVINGISEIRENTITVKWFDNERISGILNNIQDTMKVSRDMFSLCYSLEFWGKYKYWIQPLLSQQSLILMHRYIYTPLTHDVVRGTTREKIESWYEQAAMPEKIIFMNTHPEVALERILQYRCPTFYECGLDYFFFSELKDVKERYNKEMFSTEQLCDFYLKFQTKIYKNYVKEFSKKDNVLWLSENETVDLQIKRIKEFIEE